MAKKATRESYGAALVKYGENPNIVVLDADLSKSTKTEMFKKAYPERFINMGIAETSIASPNIIKYALAFLTSLKSATISSLQ